MANHFLTSHLRVGASSLGVLDAAGQDFAISDFKCNPLPELLYSAQLLDTLQSFGTVRRST